MDEEGKFVLNDKNIIPDDALVFSIIGDKKVCWQKIMNYLRDNYRGSSGNWRYYNDGKQWLFRMVNKKKTVFWLSLLSNTFRITFYFGDKARHIIESSDLPEKIIDDFKSARKYGSIRPVTIKVINDEDVDNVIKLIGLKHKIK